VVSLVPIDKRMMLSKRNRSVEVKGIKRPKNIAQSLGFRAGFLCLQNLFVSNIKREIVIIVVVAKINENSRE